MAAQSIGLVWDGYDEQWSGSALIHVRPGWNPYSDLGDAAGLAMVAGVVHGYVPSHGAWARVHHEGDSSRDGKPVRVPLKGPGSPEPHVIEQAVCRAIVRAVAIKALVTVMEASLAGKA